MYILTPKIFQIEIGVNDFFIFKEFNKKCSVNKGLNDFPSCFFSGNNIL
jgi:hypothetical protein